MWAIRDNLGEDLGARQVGADTLQPMMAGYEVN
jgi:hypothetical protein